MTKIKKNDISEYGSYFSDLISRDQGELVSDVKTGFFFLTSIGKDTSYFFFK